MKQYVFQAALLLVGAAWGIGFLVQMQDVMVNTCGHLMHVAYIGSGHYSDPDVNNTSCDVPRPQPSADDDQSLDTN